MDLKKLLETEQLCINDNLPPCTATCPIHVDIKGFMEQIQIGNFEKSYKRCFITHAYFYFSCSYPQRIIGRMINKTNNSFSNLIDSALNWFP